MITRKMNLDAIGFSASLACAIHCAGLPFLVSILPLIGLEVLANPWVEYTMIGVSMVIAFWSLWHGYQRHHHKMESIVIAQLGFVLIGVGHLFFPFWWEIALTSFGAALVAVAHLVNWQQVRRSKVKFPDCLPENQ